MSEHLVINGYRELTEDEKTVINSFKEIEANLLPQLLLLTSVSKADRRWESIGITHIQQGFMALVRSIAKPEDPVS